MQILEKKILVILEDYRLLSYIKNEAVPAGNVVIVGFFWNILLQYHSSNRWAH